MDQPLVIATGHGIENLEIWYAENVWSGYMPGWYYGFASAGCLFDGDITGPFESRRDAYNDAVNVYDLNLPAYDTL